MNDKMNNGADINIINVKPIVPGNYERNEDVSQYIEKTESQYVEEDPALIKIPVGDVVPGAKVDLIGPTKEEEPDEPEEPKDPTSIHTVIDNYVNNVGGMIVDSKDTVTNNQPSNTADILVTNRVRPKTEESIFEERNNGNMDDYGISPLSNLKNNNMNNNRANDLLAGNNIEEEKNEVEEPTDVSIEENVLEENKAEDIPVQEEIINYEFTDKDKEDLLKAYIGEDYDDICNMKFSFSSLLLGPLYYFFRKMLIFGLLASIIMVVSISILGIIGIIISVVFLVLLGFLFKPLYITYVKSKVSFIVKGNKNKSKGKLVKLCAETGRTSFTMLFLGFIIQVILVILFAFIASKIGLELKYFNLFGEKPTKKVVNKKDNSDDHAGESEDEYFHITYNIDSVILNEFTIVIPEGFKDTQYNDTYYLSYEYATDSDYSHTCEFNIVGIDDYKSSEKLIKEMAKYGNLEDKISTITLNDISWVSYSDVGRSKTYYNATNKGDKVYLFTYIINEGANRNVCEGLYQELFNSINIKK